VEVQHDDEQVRGGEEGSGHAKAPGSGQEGRSHTQAPGGCPEGGGDAQGSQRIQELTGSVLTLRCTRRLLARLDSEPITEDAAPTTRLGDWYANLLVRWSWS
jgi:hypothetical protein